MTSASVSEPTDQSTSTTEPVGLWSRPIVRWAVTLAGWAVATFILVAFVPGMLSTYIIGIGTIFLFTVPGAVGLNIVFGLCGQVSAGCAAFLAVGAFTAAGITFYQPHAPTLIVLLGAAVAGAIGGLIVGAPAVRVRGLLLLISTLAFHYIVVYAISEFQVDKVGQAGFALPDFNVFGWKPESTEQWFKTFGVAAMLALLLMHILRHSRLGRGWLAIREHELAAEVLGVYNRRAKLLAFVISSAVISVQGAMFAYYLIILQHETFTFDIAIQYIAIVIIGGLGSIAGTAAGTLLVVSLPYVLRSLAENIHSTTGILGFFTNHIFDIQSFSYGLLIVLFLLFFPDGLDGIVRSIGHRLRRAQRARSAVAPTPEGE
ncbi:MAG TPA: branched-chain amino acid ABC transporter permease [Ilumatobacteraceae bacterium]